MRPALLTAACALAALVPWYTAAEDTAGDRKIRDTIERAEEAEESSGERDAPDAPERDGDEEGGGGLLGAIAQALFQVFFEVLIESAPTQRFAAYPYEPGAAYLYNTSTFILPDERKWASLQLASDAATHLDGTWGNANRAFLQLAGFHVNVYHLAVLSESEGFSVFSANAGLTLFVPGFLLSGFAGAYTLDVLDAAYPSFGFACQLFLPVGVHLDVFNLNAVVGGEVWGHLEGTAEYQLRRLSLGAGWRYSLIAGSVFSGPCLRASLWL